MMMRSLWTAATGMKSQQLNVDNIANNLANVNTVGYKKSRVEFKSLLYETMARAGIDEEGAGSPVSLQIGHGVRPIATTKDFTMGNIEMTNNPLDLAINGEGFFAVLTPDEEVLYTRDGSFKLSVVDDELMLVTSDGYSVLDINDEPIYIPPEVSVSSLTIAEDGRLYYVDNENNTVDLDLQIQLVQFRNRAGLEAVGQNLFRQTPDSGEPMYEVDGEVNQSSKIIQGSLETSNVQVVEEMVKLIVAQRAYEINSKAIQTSDDMLAQANQLKR